MHSHTSRRKNMLRSVSAFAWVSVCVAACVGDSATTGGSDADGGPGSTVDGGGGPSTQDGAGPLSDSGGSPGVDAGCTAAACIDNGASLSCGGAKVACVYGCAPAAGGADAHCRVFDPTGSVEPSDLAQAGLKDFVGKNLKFFTDTGRITTPDEATEIRAANKTASTEEVSPDGIGFRLVPGKIGIFQFKNFTLNAADFASSNGATGTVPLAIVAAGEVKINGLLDLGCGGRLSNDYASAASFAGAGIPADNKTQVDGNGPGGGKAGNKSVKSGGLVVSGGAGGGHGGIGGAGGSALFAGGMEALVSGGAAGASYDDGTFDPPLGGSGGGGGTGPNGGSAGGGGGAVQIAAGVRITIGDGAANDASTIISQGVNVGGCGGNGSLYGGGGGGGAGGTILLESPEVVGMSRAGVASNGGGGGTGVDPSARGTISTTPASGSSGIDCSGGGTQAFGAGGAGAAGATAAGPPERRESGAIAGRPCLCTAVAVAGRPVGFASSR